MDCCKVSELPASYWFAILWKNFVRTAYALNVRAWDTVWLVPELVGVGLGVSISSVDLIVPEVCA